MSETRVLSPGSSVGLARAAVGPAAATAWDQPAWRWHAWQPKPTGPATGASAAKVATFARRVLALERARARRPPRVGFPSRRKRGPTPGEPVG